MLHCTEVSPDEPHAGEELPSTVPFSTHKQLPHNQWTANYLYIDRHVLQVIQAPEPASIQH
jgi:hypothetical protein